MGVRPTGSRNGSVWTVTTAHMRAPFIHDHSSNRRASSRFPCTGLLEEPHVPKEWALAEVFPFRASPNSHGIQIRRTILNGPVPCPIITFAYLLPTRFQCVSFFHIRASGSVNLCPTIIWSRSTWREQILL